MPQPQLIVITAQAPVEAVVQLRDNIARLVEATTLKNVEHRQQKTLQQVAVRQYPRLQRRTHPYQQAYAKIVHHARRRRRKYRRWRLCVSGSAAGGVTARGLT